MNKIDRKHPKGVLVDEGNNPEIMKIERGQIYKGGLGDLPLRAQGIFRGLGFF